MNAKFLKGENRMGGVMQNSRNEIMRIKGMLDIIRPRQGGEDFSSRGINEHRRAKDVASLLCCASLGTPELSRDYVSGFLLGNSSWPKYNGESFFFDGPVEIETLEDLGLISFEAGWLNVLGSDEIKVNDSSDSELKKTSAAYKVLKEIIYGWEGFVLPHLCISERKAEKAVNNLDILEGYEEKDNMYILLESEMDRRIADLISGYLWENLIHSFEGNGRDAFSEWISILTVFNKSYCKYQVSFFDDDSANKFSEEAVNYILEDQGVKQSWPRLRSQIEACVRTSNLFLGSGYKPVADDSKSNLKVSLDVEGETFSLSDVLDIKKEECQRMSSFPEFWGWFKEYSSSVNLFDVSRYFELINVLLAKDLKYSLFYPSERLDKLIEGSKSRPGLLVVLLGCILEVSSGLICYLLLRKDTSSVALMSIFNLLIKREENNDIEDVLWSSAIGVYNSILIESGNLDEAVDTGWLICEMVKKSLSGFDGRGDDRHSWKLKKFFELMNDPSILHASDELLESLEENNIDSICWGLYIFFWLLGCSEKSCFSERVDHQNVIEEKILGLYREYSASFGVGGALCGDASDFFSGLPWSSLSLVSIRKIVKSFDIDDVDMAYKEKGFRVNNYIKNHFSVLLEVALESSSEDARRLVNDEMVEIINRAGFSSDDRVGIFERGFSGDGSILWERACDFIKDSSCDVFSSLINGMEGGSSLDQILYLYQVLESPDRKKIIMDMIEGVDVSEGSHNFRSVVGLEEALRLSANNKMLDLSSELLFLGKSLKKGGRFDPVWEEYGYKIELLKVFYDESLECRNKVERLRGVQNPSFGSRGVTDGRSRECDRFLRMLIGIVKVDYDLDSSISIFDALYKESRNQIYLDNKFAILIEKYAGESGSASDVLYRQAINEWRSGSVKLEEPSSLSTQQVHSLFYAWLKMGEFSKIEIMWMKLSGAQKRSYRVSLVYAEAMKNAGKTDEAFSVYQGLMKRETDFTDEQRGELSSFKEALKGSVGFQSRFKALRRLHYPHERYTHESLQDSWNAIKCLPFEDLGRVVSSKAVLDEVRKEDFLKEQVVSVCRSLVRRKGNLIVRPATEKKGSYKLTKEDLINDWFVSLYNQKVSWFGLSCREQERSGVAPSGKGAGELDGYFYDNAGEGLAIFEAFRLESLSKKIIDDHLNKINGYDVNANSPVVTLCYCFANEFVQLTKKYQKHICSMQYSGFDGVDLQRHGVIEGNCIYEKNFVLLEEHRAIRSKKVIFFHVLLNFK